MKIEQMGIKRKQTLSALVMLVILGVGYFIYDSLMYVTTDNAMVMAQSTLLSAKVGGVIVRANVQENQKVKAGQVLLEISPEDYQNALTQAESERESLVAQLKGAESNYFRAKDLLKHGASTPERLDVAESQYHSLQRKLQSSSAQVAQARLNLSYTRVIALVDGQVGRRSFEVGMLAMSGQPLMGFVGGKVRWIVANLKETDMNHVSIDQTVQVRVDSISEKAFSGVVESISPATGATFSLLPPDNATGNFTKVVQRVPVRIKLLNLMDHDIDKLQAGLSADVKIKIH